MNTTRIYFSYVFFLIIAGVVTGCYKKAEHLTLANAQPEFLYPLIDAELNLKDIVDPNKKNLNITENTDGYYTFIYYENVFDQYISDYLKIADLSINQSASLTVGEITSPVAGTVSHNFSNNFTLQTSNGEQLKNIRVKSGTIPLSVSSTFTASLQLAITFPYIKKNGIALTKTITLAGNGSFTDNIDLTGYNIDLTKGSTTVNTISYDAVLKVTVVPGNTITPAQKVSISTGIQNIAYSYADGYIGKYALTIPQDTLSIDIFNTAYAGNVFFSDPKVSAIIFNSVGVPATVKINSLSTLSNILGYTVITGSKINVDIPIEYPLLPSEPGKTTTIQLDKTNSNVQTVFNPAPDKVIYNIDATINKAGNTGAANFVTDSSKFIVKGQVEIPMEGKITKLVLLDTIKGMTYPEISIGKDVTVLNAGFLVSIDNGFPMDAMLQMYFLDSTNVIIDSLFAKGPQLILSGQINADGKVISSTHTLMKELFNEQRYSRITKTKNAALYVFFRTANNGTVPVKIYPSYKIKSNIAIDVKADVSF